jgi:hypothetical protein
MLLLFATLSKHRHTFLVAVLPPGAVGGLSHDADCEATFACTAAIFAVPALLPALHVLIQRLHVRDSQTVLPGSSTVVPSLQTRASDG